ncbi:ATP-binding cassette domain-containing protein [Paraburkholderia sp. IMGN_8]|uniref:ATP-binding cassette domain-containing protein n=1 Tax=Paraburkholderia sp. IMGN_8 TaxID=3136564 RepID=UPI003100D08F
MSGIECGYGGGKVFDCVSMTVTRGEIIALIGRNCVGKSTLMRALSGPCRSRKPDIGDRAKFRLAHLGERRIYSGSAKRLCSHNPNVAIDRVFGPAKNWADSQTRIWPRPIYRRKLIEGTPITDSG